jgi:hypothetical protein
MHVVSGHTCVSHVCVFSFITAVAPASQWRVVSASDALAVWRVAGGWRFDWWAHNGWALLGARSSAASGVLWKSLDSIVIII